MMGGVTVDGQGDKNIDFVADRRVLAPWEAVRRALPELRRWLGDEAIDAAAASERARLSLVLRPLRAGLTAEQELERYSSSAQTLESLPAFVGPAALVASWGRFLTRAIGARSVVLRVSDLGSIDPESLEVLRHVLSHHATGQARLELHGSQTPRPTVEPAAGAAAMVAGVAEELALTTGVELFPEPLASGSADDPLTQPLDVLDDGIEWRSLAELSRAGPVLAVAMVDRLCAAIAAAFEAFGYRTVVALGQALLERQADFPNRHDVRLQVALAAARLIYAKHDFFTKLFQRLAGEILLDSPSSTTRCLVAYRLSVIALRLHGELGIGREHAERAVLESEALDVSPARDAYFRAWALSARALADYRLGAHAQAQRDSELSLRLLSEVSPAPDDFPASLVNAGRWHVLSNMARLADVGGRRVEASVWAERWAELDWELGLTYQPPYTRLWARLCHQRLDEGIGRHAAHAERAAREKRPRLEAVYRETLGLLRYRRGDVAEAFGDYTRARAIWRGVRLFADPAGMAFWRGSEEARATSAYAAAAARAGDLDVAREWLEAALGDAGSPGDRARLLARLCWVRSFRPGAADLEQRLDELRSERAQLTAEAAVHAARVEGQALLAIGERRAAVRAFQVALEESKRAKRRDSEDWLCAALGLAACGEGSGEILEQALELLPDALDGSDAWWELPALLRWIAEAVTSSGALRASHERLGYLCAVATQRPDSLELGAQLGTLLATHQLPG